MDRIERLERANSRWRLVSLAAITGMLIVGGYAFSQREQKAPEGQPPPADFRVNAAASSVTYTNFVRVSVTPEELILDLALNTQMNANPKQSIDAAHRVVMNFFTAKRLSNALQGVVQQYEATYGPLELDFQKRMRPGMAK